MIDNVSKKAILRMLVNDIICARETKFGYEPLNKPNSLGAKAYEEAHEFGKLCRMLLTPYTNNKIKDLFIIRSIIDDYYPDEYLHIYEKDFRQRIVECKIILHNIFQKLSINV